jgi:hypothetical protein
MAPPDAQAEASYSVEPLSPMAPPDAQAEAPYSVEPLSPMAPPDAQAEAPYGFFGCFVLLAAVPSSSDRLGTIDLP